MKRALVVALLFGLLVVAVAWWHNSNSHRVITQSFDTKRQLAPPGPPIFNGVVKELPATTILPTLDTPAPAGDNLVWCGGFDRAWANLRALYGGKPIELPSTPDLAARLNHESEQPVPLPKGQYFAVAGDVASGAQKQAEAEYAKLFPDAQPFPLKRDLKAEEVVTYVGLRASVVFGEQFEQDPVDMVFGTGEEASGVACFGVPEQDRHVKSRRQVEVLYCSEEEGLGRLPSPVFPETAEFILDLDKGSQPSQVLVCRVHPGATLEQTVDRALQLAEGWQPQSADARELGEAESLAVPELSFAVDYRFPQLQGQGIGLPSINPGQPPHATNIVDVGLLIDFRMNAEGVWVSAVPRLVAGGMARRFVFDRPFLVLMRVRGEREPYFAMWVANAELMKKR